MAAFTIFHEGTVYTAVCDDKRHLIVQPYNVDALHVLAEKLGIKRCWYHGGSKFLHYDIPLKRIESVMALCRVVTSKQIVRIVKNAMHPMARAMIGPIYEGAIKTPCPQDDQAEA